MCIQLKCFTAIKWLKDRVKLKELAYFISFMSIISTGKCVKPFLIGLFTKLWLKIFKIPNLWLLLKKFQLLWSGLKKFPIYSSVWPVWLFLGPFRQWEWRNGPLEYFKGISPVPLAKCFDRTESNRTDRFGSIGSVRSVLTVTDSVWFNFGF